MVWFGKKMWLCLKWIGNKMTEHFRYRSDELYWFNVANSKDRLVYIKEEDFQYSHF